jgi:hypothetical protein
MQDFTELVVLSYLVLALQVVEAQAHFYLDRVIPKAVMEVQSSLQLGLEIPGPGEM